MSTLKCTRFVACMLALGCIVSVVTAHAVHFERDLYGEEVQSIAEETDDDDYLEGEMSQESAREEASIPGPKNVVLFFARFPPARKKHVGNKMNGSEVVYFGFPVQSSVGVTANNAKPGDSSADLAALIRKRRAAPASSDSSNCKVELDASVAKLLEWARNSRFMATGVVANGKHSQEMTLTQVHKGSGGMETLREFAKEGGFARDAAKRVKGRSSGVDPSDVDPGGVIRDGVEHSSAVHSGVDHVGVGHSGVDQSGVDHSGLDRSAVDHSGVDHSGVDHSAVDHSGINHSGVDHSAINHSGVDHSGVDHSGVDSSGVDGSGVTPSGGAIHSGAVEGVGSCVVDTVSVRKREAADHIVLPKVDTSLDPFKKLDIFRRYIFDNIFNFIGFDFADNLDSDLQGMELKAINPATELVRGVLKGLQAEAGDTGFVLVVSAGELADLNDAVRLVRDRTDAAETLIAVAGQCPGDDAEAIGIKPLPNHLRMDRVPGSRPGGAVRRRSVEMKNPQVPLYATGPKSDQLGKVDLLWKIPTEIQRIMKADIKRSRESTARSAVAMKRREGKEYDVDNANDNGRVRGSFMKAAGVKGKVGVSSAVDDNDDDEMSMEEYIGEDEMARRGGKRSKKGVDTEDFNVEDEKVGRVGKRSKNGVDIEDLNGEEGKVGKVGKSSKKGVENEDYIEEDETVAKGRKRSKKGLVMDNYNGEDEKEARERKRSKKGVELEEVNEKDETAVKRGKRSKEGLTKAEDEAEGRVGHRTKKGVMDEGGEDSGTSLQVSAVAMAVGVVVVAVYIKLLIEA